MLLRKDQILKPNIGGRSAFILPSISQLQPGLDEYHAKGFINRLKANWIILVDFLRHSTAHLLV